jgi:hypothetical protein
MPFEPHAVAGSTRPYRRRTKRRAYNKKTTRRGAYKPRNKKQMKRRRAPFVETKSKTHEDLVVQFPGLVDRSVFRTYNTESAHFNPETFYMWKRGMEENEVIGNSCYCSYLKMKLGIRFPQPAFSVSGMKKQIPMTPQNYELIWGWVPNEFGYTGQTTPTADNANINDLMAHVNQRVTDYVNEQKDKIRFIPKAASTIRITGRRKIRPDMRFLSTAPPVTTDASVGNDYAVGTIPDRFTSISWKMNKKLHLQPSSKLHSGDPGLYAGNFGTWLPFCTLVNWDWENLPEGTAREAYCPAVQINDCVWYSDS